MLALASVVAKAKFNAEALHALIADPEVKARWWRKTNKRWAQSVRRADPASSATKCSRAESFGVRAPDGGN
jgi:hypothetical protein